MPKMTEKSKIVKSFIVDFAALTPLLIVRSIFHALTKQLFQGFANESYHLISHINVLTKGIDLN